MHLWHDVPVGEGAPRLVNAVIEIPQSSKVKYEVDHDLGVLRASRVLYGAVHYPANYGFIPRTLAEDGDALDILVLSQEQVIPGALASARVIGVMPMVDAGEPDDKIIAVQLGDPGFEAIQSLDDLPPFRMHEIMRFFGDYKALEGKEVQVAAPLGIARAVETIERSIETYDQAHGRGPSAGPSAEPTGEG